MMVIRLVLVILSELIVDNMAVIMLIDDQIELKCFNMLNESPRKDLSQK